MRSVLYILIGLLPSFLHKGIRKLLGQKIGKGSKLKFGSFIFCKDLEIGKGSKIGPLTVIKADSLKVGDYSSVKPLVLIKTRVIKIENYVHIAPLAMVTSEFTENSKLEIGDHSRIFPYCWLDTGEGITIGKQVGVGGHTLIFTHGVWANYIDGGPVSFGPVVIEDNVWLPWRVFILPNVTIGTNSIIGANSLINKSIESDSLAAGNPAKVLKTLEFNSPDKKERFLTVLEAFSKYLNFKYKTNYQISKEQLILKNGKIVIDEIDEVQSGDLLIVLDPNMDLIKEQIKQNVVVLDYSSLTIHFNGVKNNEMYVFVDFLRRYGVRLYIS